MKNKFGLSDSIWRKAVTEIVESLRTNLSSIITDDRDEAAKEDFVAEATEILEERIKTIKHENNGFMHRLEKAKIKAHSDSLLKGHHKGLRHHLRATPGGVSKDTAKEIISELFNLGKD